MNFSKLNTKNKYINSGILLLAGFLIFVFASFSRLDVNAMNLSDVTSDASGQTSGTENNKESDSTAASGSTSANTASTATGKWVNSGGGWWYDNGDGTYARNEYIEGYWLEDSGWYNAAWYGSWKSNSKGWWFQSGTWYPQSSWLKIDHKWYYFGSDGYMKSSEWILSDGAWYYLTESGAMAVSTTIDGKEVDASGKWEDKTPLVDLVTKSETAKKTSQIITVVNHDLTFWQKQADGTWKSGETMYCGYGKNGFSVAENRTMGDKTTPKGSFELTYAFGKAENPGTEMTYRSITPYSYLSSERDTYNTWVESEKNVIGEHLTDYYQYKYAVNIGFNINPTVYGRGAGIFLHCKSYDHWYTSGCVSLEESDMVSVLKQLKNGAYMIIVEEKSEIKDY